MKNYANHIIADNFNELFLDGIYTIDLFGKWTKPRGFDCKEIIGAQLILTNPKNCLCTIEDRKLNYAYLIIEKMMYLSQICVPSILIAYNSKMGNYINENTKDFDGAYGPRIGKNSQLKYCYEQLKSDKDSRQAVITINDFTDRHVSKDIPCTMYLHFLIREGKLDLIANMRSNDILWGLCLDIPAFCFLQEVMAFWLGVEVGNYIHNDSSLHYYKEYEEKLLSFLKMEKQDHYRILNYNICNFETIPEWNIKFEETEKALNDFWLEENNIREHGSYNQTKYNVINNYLDRLLKYNLYKDTKKNV
jgi:thymidylate synthase